MRIDFKKVEVILEEGLRLISISRLLNLADIAAGIGQSKISLRTKSSLDEDQKSILRGLELNLMRLRNEDSKIYAKLKIKKSSLDLVISHANELDESDWKKLAALYRKTNELILEYFPSQTDDDLIKKELERHINKRFNVSEKWLPLE